MLSCSSFEGAEGEMRGLDAEAFPAGSEDGAVGLQALGSEAVGSTERPVPV